MHIHDGMDGNYKITTTGSIPALSVSVNLRFYPGIISSKISFYKNRRMRDVQSAYCRRENSVRQRQSLQIGHEAVGQEGVDGCDLRRGSRFNWKKRVRSIQRASVFMYLLYHLL